jgi:mannose-6-phosphate isomerase-like protein (cupin superfamily)
MTMLNRHLDLVELARSNEDFRRVLETGAHAQVVAMTIPVGDEIGAEVHPDTDQLFVLEAGLARVEQDDRSATVRPGEIVFVHAGTRHNIVNAGGEPLRLVTIYAPPHHAPDTVHRTRAEADAAE